MGLLSEADWNAAWIGLDRAVGNDKPDTQFRQLSARMVRKEFEATKGVRRATAYVCGLGLFELRINGKKVGRQVLVPALSEYPKRSFYLTFDVTKELLNGKNAVGVILGNGRFFASRQAFAPNQDIRIETNTYGYPKMIFRMDIEYADNTRQSLVSDATWRITAHGPITANSEYDGEDYDARKEMAGWDEAGFDDSGWMNAAKVGDPSEKLSAQPIAPIRVMEIMKPKSVKEIKPGVHIFDMGQNMVGWVSLAVRAKRGTSVQMRFAETLNPDGSLYTDNLRAAKQTDTYIARGGGVEQWEPRFTYHGFRYVELTGYPGRPQLSTIEGKVVYDDMRTTGSFNCSNDIINKVYKAAYWTMRGNYRSIPTDCPQRDERQAWLGDRSMNSYGESFIFDNNKFYEKWMTDIADAQSDSGSIPDLAPGYWTVRTDNMTWPSSLLIISNNLYRQFGNIKVIADNYEAMKKWLFYMRDKYMKNYLLPQDMYGDWCIPPKTPTTTIWSQDPAMMTPREYIGSTYLYYCLRLMEQHANLLNKEEDAGEYSSLADKVRDAINNTYLNKDSLYYANNTVTANALALSFGVLPKQTTSDVFKNLSLRMIRDYRGHTSTGLVGGQWILRTLTDHGRIDLAYKLATNRDYPSWGYMVEQGGSTIWELWNGATADPLMNSHNHVMLLGDLVVWYYEDLAGIKSDPARSGFKHIIMKPCPVGNLRFVKASYESIYGPIRSEWRLQGARFGWDVSVPANTTATVFVPAAKESDVTESGNRASQADGVTFVKLEDGRAVYEIGSGSYHFVSQGNGVEH
jgi:alpha-L-rhamnosidase